jgi:hypothetical protein
MVNETTNMVVLCLPMLSHRAVLTSGRPTSSRADPLPVGVLHAPGGLAVADLELRLERLGVLAVEAAAVLDVTWKRTLLYRVVARPAQAEDVSSAR